MKALQSISEIIAIAGNNSPKLEGITEAEMKACKLADAAPDMLAALIELITILPEKDTRSWHKARDAIVKATDQSISKAKVQSC